MTAFVVDTNVAIAANGGEKIHADVQFRSQRRQVDGDGEEAPCMEGDGTRWLSLW